MSPDGAGVAVKPCSVTHTGSSRYGPGDLNQTGVPLPCQPRSTDTISPSSDGIRCTCTVQRRASLPQVTCRGCPPGGWNRSTVGECGIAADVMTDPWAVPVASTATHARKSSRVSVADVLTGCDARQPLDTATW